MQRNLAMTNNSPFSRSFKIQRPRRVGSSSRSLFSQDQMDDSDSGRISSARIGLDMSSSDRLSRRSSTMDMSDSSRRRRMDKQLFLARQSTKINSNATWDKPSSSQKKNVDESPELGFNATEEAPKFLTFKRRRPTLSRRENLFD